MYIVTGHIAIKHTQHIPTKIVFTYIPHILPHILPVVSHTSLPQMSKLKSTLYPVCFLTCSLN